LARLVGIEYLRAGAATAVMLFHYALASGYSGALVALGQFGVDVFFVISGFIMWTVSRDEASPVRFLVRRIVRIAPLYWLATLAAALVATEGGVRLGLGAPAGDLAKALFFVPAYSARSPDVVEPILSVGWTLNLEMAFYALFAASLAAPRRLRLILLVCALLLLPAAGYLAEPSGAALSLWTRSVVAEFAMGLVIGAVYARATARDRAILSPDAGAALVFLGLASAAFGDPDSSLRGLLWGAPAAMIVIGALALEPRLAGRPSRLLLLVGAASYALYLTHGMQLALSTALFAPLLDALPSAPRLAALCVGGICAGVAAHLAVERPIDRMLRGQRGRADFSGRLSQRARGI
jgi:exopolysaccharide production protein ExoZ